MSRKKNKKSKIFIGNDINTGKPIFVEVDNNLPVKIVFNQKNEAGGRVILDDYENN